MKNIIAVLAGLFMSLTAVKAQSKDAAENKRIVESKNYIIKVQSVTPRRGLNMNNALGNEYDLTVKPDTVISFLPFFGRAYTAPIDPTQGGIKFTSVKFSYDQATRRKGGWEIRIKPTDAPGVQEINIDLFDDGMANLRVTSTNRDPMSFSGYFIEGTTPEKKAF